MTQSQWRIASREHIQAALLEWEAQSLLLNEKASPKDALQRISKAYPFGQRKMHPYKIWLSEVKAAKAFLQTGWNAHQFTGFAERYHNAKRRQDPKPSPGQMSLI